MQRILLIDGNSVGFAAQNGTKLTVGSRQVQAIFGFIRSVRLALTRFPDATPIVLWDGKAQWRFDIFPGYKDRAGKNQEMDEMREAFHEQRPDIARAMHMLGVTQMRDEDLEADDIAYHLVKKWSPIKKIVLETGDGDWKQLINENTIWFDHRKDDEPTVGVANFLDNTGYLTPQHFVQGKALTGDTSDTIPGVGGIGEKGAPEFLATYGSVENFFKLADEGKLGKVGVVYQRFAKNECPPDSKKYGKLAPMRDAYYRNMKLVDLSQAPEPKRLNIARGKYNEQAFKGFCAELLFNSILRDFDNWLSPFRGQVSKVA